MASPNLYHCHEFLIAFLNLISRDLLAVVVPQEHPSCLVLQVRRLGERVPLWEQGVLEGRKFRPQAYHPYLPSSIYPTRYLNVRDLGDGGPWCHSPARWPQLGHSSGSRMGQSGEIQE